MTTMEQFISKLNKLNLRINSEDKALMSEDGWKVQRSFNVSTRVEAGDPTIQCVIRVSYNGHYVDSYGAVTDDESQKLAVWFEERYNDTRNKTYDENEHHQRCAQKIFKSL